jgi:hypothetical protein
MRVTGSGSEVDSGGGALAAVLSAVDEPVELLLWRAASLAAPRPVCVCVTPPLISVRDGSRQLRATHLSAQLKEGEGEGERERERERETEREGERERGREGERERE